MSDPALAGMYIWDPALAGLRELQSPNRVYYEDHAAMVDTLSSQPASPPARGLASRIFGVVTSPRATYADIAARPRWLGVLLVVLATTIASSSWLLSTSVGQRAVIDQQLQTLEGFGRTVSD